MTSVDLRERLRDEARRLGFSRMGVAEAGPCRDAGRLQDWLEDGFHGEMAWMARDPERRSDPARLLPGARSVIVLLTFYSGPGGEESPTSAGRVSRYARGRDYHNVLGKRLRKLGRFLEEQVPGARAAAAVDHRPILEKEWAERAGLGWIGKHTNLITKDGGSWFFLSELVTDVALPPDPARPADGRGPAPLPPDAKPRGGHCGRCTDCLTACPTGAIVAPWRVDARRCISYLTIELKGPIPRDLRPLVGEWIFGCDVCQDVCPWNRFAAPVDDPSFDADAARWSGNPDDVLSLDDAAFRERFRGSPVRRAGRDGFLRNVCVALGNRADPDTVPALTRALDDDAPLVRGHAAWALGRIGNDAARRALHRRAEREADPDVREEIAAAAPETGAGRDQ